MRICADRFGREGEDPTFPEEAGPLKRQEISAALVTGKPDEKLQNSMRVARPLFMCPCVNRGNLVIPGKTFECPTSEAEPCVWLF